MNRQQRRAQRKVKDMVHTTTLKGSDGLYYWFEHPPGYRYGDLPLPETEFYGPFATEAESDESQRLVLFGPECELRDRGMWDPAWDRLQ
jgi:hypothetical protein